MHTAQKPEASNVRWVVGSIILALFLIVGGANLLVTLSHHVSHNPTSLNYMKGMAVRDVEKANN